MRFYRNNNPIYTWHGDPRELAVQYWASPQAQALQSGRFNIDLAGSVAAWLRDPAAHGSSWDTGERDGFNELVAEVQAARPLGRTDDAMSRAVAEAMAELDATEDGADRP